MFDRIICLDNLFAAWREFRRGKRTRADVQVFEFDLEKHLCALHMDLASGNYRHGGYRRFRICDPKPRMIHKASVRDRLVHHAIHQVLNPLFERSFIFDSYSCRIGKGTHAGVKRLEVFTRRVSKNYRGSCWALKLDVRKFFDSVDHGILLSLLKRKIVCSRTFDLLCEIVGSYKTPTSSLRPLTEGSVGGGGATRKGVANRESNLTAFCQCVFGYL